MKCNGCEQDASGVGPDGLAYCGEECCEISQMRGGYMVEGENGGKKSDGGKLRYDLLYFPFMDGIVSVLTFGAKKYEPNNWKKVERWRYEGAIMRHISLYLQGEKKDSETGFSHLYHIACTAMFLDYYDSINKV